MRLLIREASKPPTRAVIPCGQENIKVSVLTCAALRERKDKATETPIQRNAHFPAAAIIILRICDNFFRQQYIKHNSALPQAIIGTITIIEGPTPISEAMIAEHTPIVMPQYIPYISEKTNKTQLTRLPVIICDVDTPISGI